MEFLKFYLEGAFSFAAAWWWLGAPPYLYAIMKKFWTYDISYRYYRSDKFVLLKINVPREEERSPQLMENVLHGLWTVYGNIKTFMEVYSWGYMPDYMSLEIAGVEGKVYFTVRVFKLYTEQFKAHIYAQYPDAEIEVMEEDYVKLVPTDIPNDEWDLWGTQWTVQKPDVYPIRTYFEFEDKMSGTMVDPVAAFMEVLGKLGPGEHIWYHLILEPVPNDVWEEEFRNEVEVILDRGKGKKRFDLKKKLADDLKTFPAQTISAMFKYYEIEAKKEEEKTSPLLRLSPGEQESIKAMERSISKRGFRAQYSVIYIARKDAYRGHNIMSMMGAINQFNTVDLNGFAIYKPYMTSTHSWFSKRRLNYKKRRLLRIMRPRKWSGKQNILNTEEIATLWHFPDISVKAPQTPRVAAKKASAPSNLPIGTT